MCSQWLNILIIGAVLILKRLARNYSSSSYNYSKLFSIILGRVLQSLSINISILNLNSLGSSKIWTYIFLSSNLAGKLQMYYASNTSIGYNLLTSISAAILRFSLSLSIPARLSVRSHDLFWPTSNIACSTISHFSGSKTIYLSLTVRWRFNLSALRLSEIVLRPAMPESLR